MNAIAVLLILGGLHGLLLAAALFSMQRGRRRANRILAALLTLFSLNIILHTLAHTNAGIDFPGRTFIAPVLETVFEPLFYFIVMAFLFGPLFLFYVRARVIREYRIAGWEFAHFAPAALAFLIFTPILFLLPASAGTHPPADDSILHGIITAVSWLVVPHLFTYIFVTIRALQKHSRDLGRDLSSLEKTNLHWLRFLIVAYSVTWLAAIGIELAQGGIEAWNYIFLLVSVLMYGIGYQGLRRPEVFAGEAPAHDNVESAKSKKYEKSTLTPKKAEEALQKLHALMAAGKPHLQTDLTLNALAKKLAISSHHLSQVINEKTGMNFFEFVNSHRVREAQRLIAEPSAANLTLAEIGFQAGFNSISSFNSAFKKHAGATPSAFRKSQT